MISPQLFNEYVKDLGNHLNKSLGVKLIIIIRHLFFADDLIIISDSPEELQKQLDLQHSYNQKWHLITSIEKTKVMIFNPKFVKKFAPFKLGDRDIEICSNYKYLGLMCCDKENDIFKDSYNYIANQAKKALFSLRKIQSRIGKLSPNLALNAFDTLIVPILEFGGKILYTGKKINEYEKIHLNFLKAMLGVIQQTPTIAVLGDTGRFPLLLRQKILAIGY